MSTLNPEFYAPYNYTPDVAKARHNLSTKRAHTVQTGALHPILFHRLYKGDDFKIRPMTLLQTILPLERQLLDCFELRVETYLCPLTNYYGWMDNNSRESSGSIVKNSGKWRVQLINGPEDSGEGLLDSDAFLAEFKHVDNASSYESRLRTSSHQIQKGSLFQLIGVPAGFVGSSNGNNGVFLETMFNTVNIERILCYLDIVRSYHVNTQYDSIPFYNGTDRTTAVSDDFLFSFPFTHQQLDDLFVNLRYFSNHVNRNLSLPSLSSVDPDSVFYPLLQYLTYCTRQGGGLFPVQHRPDLWRNLLSVSGGELDSKVTQNSDGTINIHEIQDKSHLQSFYDALYLSGGRYFNRLRTSFGMKPHQNLHIPQLLSVDRQLIDPSNITATAQGGDYDLGEMAAKVDKFNSGGYVRVRPDVDSYLVVVASITPLPAYSQGFDPDVTHLSFMDDFTPELQGMSFESIPRGYYSALPESHFGQESGQAFVSIPNLSTEVGKNVKWMHYRSDVNRCYGEFTPFYGDYDNMVLTRKYSNFGGSTENDSEPYVSSMYFDIGPYVNPLEYNNVFALNSLYQEPWSLHVSFDVKAKRPILKRIKPSF